MVECEILEHNIRGGCCKEAQAMSEELWRLLKEIDMLKRKVRRDRNRTW